ncbi:MAG: Kiwa anti-phage protein KwaB-like domain-containing protein [Eubacteriales bacterium]
MQSKTLSKKDLKNVFLDFQKNVENASNKLILFDRTKTKDKYKAYFLEGNETVVNKLINKSIENVLTLLPKRQICQYYFDVSEDEVIQTVDTEKVINGKEILEDMNVTAKPTFVDDKIDFDKFKFAVMDITMQIDEHRKRIVLFKKYHQPAATFKESYKYTFCGKTMEEVTNPILSFNSQVDAFLYEDTYYVINRNSFNSIFEFKDLFIKVVDENTEKIEKMEILQNAKEFIDECKSDGRYLPRLTKAILANRFETCKENMGKISSIIKTRNLSIKLTEDKKIEYVGKQGIKEIIDLLLEHYVISELTDEKLIAVAIEKYNK